MTELAFHFGAPDKLAYACRLLRKAVGSGARVVVVADHETLALLDAQLWALSPTEFLPHWTETTEPSLQRRSPLVLVTQLDQALNENDVLVNLADAVPQGFEKFERLIEVVSLDAMDRDLARARWRQYTERGYPIARHDLNLKRTD